MGASQDSRKAVVLFGETHIFHFEEEGLLRDYELKLLAKRSQC